MPGRKVVAVRRHVALLLAAVIPTVAVPAHAGPPLLTGCHYKLLRDRTDPQSTTWIGTLSATYVGTTVPWKVTCWFQETKTMTTSLQGDPTAGGYTNPQPNMEIPNTRVTCVGNRPEDVCPSVV